MGYVFSYHDVMVYEQWLRHPNNRRHTEMENALMLKMLAPRRSETVLEIGCGSGARLMPLIEAGLDVTGIEPSAYALEMASQKIGRRADFYQGTAEDLPFDDNAFHYACLIKTLEFADDPQKAIEEACRVAKYRVFVGAVNRQSIEGVRLRAVRLFKTTLYDHARLFSIWELKRIIRSLSGDAPITWRTLVRLSASSGRIARWFQQSSIVQRFPFGAFAGITIFLQPRFRTTPLELKIPFGVPMQEHMEGCFKIGKEKHR